MSSTEPTVRSGDITTAVLRAAVVISGVFCAFVVAGNALQVYGPSWWRPVVACNEPSVTRYFSEPGEKLSVEFDVHNGGGRVLEIHDIMSGCGCTTVGLTDFPLNVPAGGHVSVPVVFDTSGKTGNAKFVEPVLVHTNDLVNPVLQLTVTAIPQTPAK